MAPPGWQGGRVDCSGRGVAAESVTMTMTKNKPDPSAALVIKLQRQLNASNIELADARKLVLLQQEKIERLERQIARMDTGDSVTITSDDGPLLIKWLIQECGMVDAVLLWDWLAHDYIGMTRPERIVPEQADGAF